MTVLVVGEDGDWSGDAVATELVDRGESVFRLDTADFPQRARLCATLSGGRAGSEWWDARIVTNDATIPLSELSSIYYRKPGDFELDPEMSAPERRFARKQARVGIGGVLSSLPVRWINNMAAIADAEYEPTQLSLAARCGFAVPPTLVTNDPREVSAFAECHGDLIVKPLAAPLVFECGGTSAVYTRLLADDKLTNLDGVDSTAHLFQPFVEKRYEVRMIVVGDQVFPVAIHTDSEAGRVDWRRDYESHRYDVVACPPGIAKATRCFLNRVGLVYGAFDFIVSRESGEWVMLECNAAGQWGWLAEECGLPIAAAIADELTTKETVR